ncbi:hypothetical protein OS189_09100 [Sulfitobacter sp. F26169L]|uniref:hypothetical protein n=1 Tax=Sulfitobacter sp. F26169L TaxID=2996015 RepID=UPI002261048F|nr:hypothetical protein [Sulfitobacter sp. F26169L]MCX7566495.1 hypothetical protein [Sulfitobacter sp. F26169L]
MGDVAQATAKQEVAEAIPHLQELTLRVNGPPTMRLPDDTTVYVGDTVLGTLTEATATVPGLTASLPVGRVTVRVEGSDVTGELVADVMQNTTLLVIDTEAVAPDYILFRNGQFPVLRPDRLPLANQHFVMVKNAMSVDRNSHYYTYLYPFGCTDETLRIKGGNIGSRAGMSNLNLITSPTTPGDYDPVMMRTNREEYCRIPVAFAAEIPLFGKARAKPNPVLLSTRSGLALAVTETSFYSCAQIRHYRTHPTVAAPYTKYGNPRRV